MDQPIGFVENREEAKFADSDDPSMA